MKTAVDKIGRGKERYVRSQRLMITADAGGSNGYRVRLWKVELQKLATELGLSSYSPDHNLDELLPAPNYPSPKR